MKSIYLFILILVVTSCREKKGLVYDNQPLVYPSAELRANDPTFQIEAKLPYHDNNLIFNSCYEVLYSYYYSKDNETKYSNSTSFRKWSFITKDSLELGKGFKYIRLSAPNPNLDYNYEPQSTIKYEYLNAKGEVRLTSHTGVVENHKNIIIHNPRGGIFLSLFSFPWPSIKFPLEINNSWEWSWSYNGETFSDERLFSWNGITKMEYTYTVKGKMVIDTPIGKIDTYEIEAVGTDGKITNTLTYYFNSKLGFIKQVFKTHDGAEILLELIGYTNKCESGN